MSEAFAKRDVPLEVHHVSGHAYVSDLRRLVDAVLPTRVVLGLIRLGGQVDYATCCSCLFRYRRSNSAGLM